MQLSGERRNDETDRLGGAGRGRHEVRGRRPRAPVVLVRPVEQLLVTRVGVHGRHLSVADPDRLVKHLRNRRQAVRRARSIRGSRGAIRGRKRRSSPSATVTSGSFACAETITLRAPAARCCSASARFRWRPVDSITMSTSSSAHGSFEGSRSVGVSIASRPRQGAVGDLDRSGERSVHGVVLQQLGEHRGIRDVVDRDPLDVGAGLVRRAEGSATRSAEAVDGDADRHGSSLDRVQFDPRVPRTEPARHR